MFTSSSSYFFFFIDFSFNNYFYSLSTLYNTVCVCTNVIGLDRDAFSLQTRDELIIVGLIN